MITADTREKLVKAARCKEPVSGLTHEFYRYPARFSPVFAHAVIDAFTQEGQSVLDPFMGGGTTLVEACAMGRRAGGCDVSSLAAFLSRVKTTVYSQDELQAVSDWAVQMADWINLRNDSVRPQQWLRAGYQRNINSRRTWPIRKALELAISRLVDLSSARERALARCILLRTGQWALDSRKSIPSVADFRKQLVPYAEDVIAGAGSFAAAVQASDRGPRHGELRATCLEGSAANIEMHEELSALCPPKLILTSPPYPGVHVLYHRWQVKGRKETPAPFWIANCMDSKGEAYYTMGGRHESGIETYFEQLIAIFDSLARLADSSTVLAQMIGFSEPDWQLPCYLSALTNAGFHEVRLGERMDTPDCRLWRQVPNRKWHANRQGQTPSCQEVVLFHRLA